MSDTGALTLLEQSLQHHAVSPSSLHHDQLSVRLVAAGVVSQPVGTVRIVVVDSTGCILVRRLGIEEDAPSAHSAGEDWLGSRGEPLNVLNADVSEDGVVTALGMYWSLACFTQG